MKLERVFGDFTFSKPSQLVPFPAEPGAWLVAQHAGIVEVVKEGSRRNYFDISDRVQIGQQWGFQDFALHPRFPGDPRIFVAYVAADDVSVVSSFSASADGATVDVASETVLMSEGQKGHWHPIASLEFGPDGYLYVAWGEGSGKKSQIPALLGGKMLRIDVDRRDGALPYAIPRDNPFLGTAFRPETFAIGLRNPWRFSFDRDNGELWLGDVGDRSYEEVNRIVAGGNYGFPDWEGTACFEPEGCRDPSVIPPVVQHSKPEMCSITGGYVYRGDALPQLRGRYVYGDVCSGTIWALGKDESGNTITEPIARAPSYVCAFAEAPDGELYVLESHDTHDDHLQVESGFKVHRLVADPAASSDAGASSDETLAGAACVADGGDFAAAPSGMVRYALNHPAWADGADTVYFMSEGQGAEIYGDQDILERPRKSVLLKTFTFAGRPIETQLLVGQRDRTWVALDYEWDEAGRDAKLLAKGKTKRLPDGSDWTFPGPEGCARCHHSQVGPVRALRLSQLARTLDGGDQLEILEEMKIVRWRPEESGTVKNPMPRLDDESISVERRARAYLDVNCSSCHQPGGNAGEAGMDLRRTTPLVSARVCDRAPSAAFPDHESAVLLAPGEPERSLISVRMNATGVMAMPPQRHKVDPLGTKTVDAWISSLTACPVDVAAQQ